MTELNFPRNSKKLMDGLLKEVQEAVAKCPSCKRHWSAPQEVYFIEQNSVCQGCFEWEGDLREAYYQDQYSQI